MQLEIIDRHGRVVRPYRRGDCLADGERIRVPVLMDHASWGFRSTFADGSADHTSPHRPGFRFADTNDADRLAAQQAYIERTARLENGWRRSRDADDNAPIQCSDAAQARAVADRVYEDRKVWLSNAWRNR